MEILDGPRIERRPTTPTVGIRVVTPFRGMLAERDRLLAELTAWLDGRGLLVTGPFFLRLHVIDMAQDMEIEVGAMGVSDAGDDRVRPGTVPAGDYAVLVHRGGSRQVNRTLLEWAHADGVVFDTTPSDGGDLWAARFEILRTDPRSERRKTRWITELAFLTRSDAELARD